MTGQTDEKGTRRPRSGPRPEGLTGGVYLPTRTFTPRTGLISTHAPNYGFTVLTRPYDEP